MPGIEESGDRRRKKRGVNPVRQRFQYNRDAEDKRCRGIREITTQRDLIMKWLTIQSWKTGNAMPEANPVDPLQREMP